MTSDSLKTPLHEAHLAWGARMVDFAGWDMPIQYAGITEEHLHTRGACSAFDVSHMGRLRLTGGDCQRLLDRLCTRNLAKAEVGRCYYSHVCREDGGILDDVIVSRFEDAWGVVCNASNRAKIVAWIGKHAAGLDVKLRDETTSTAMVAVQGPRTAEVAAGLVDVDLGDIKRYRFKVFALLMANIIVYRSGYTGEDGYELVLPAGLVKLLLPRLVGTKDKPHPVVRWAGLGARDTLRMEAAMPLYGHELTEEWDSLTAGQEWCVDLTKDFIGAEAMRRMKEAGLARRLVGLELEGRRIARQYYPVYAGERKVGEITSGTLSPTLGKSIAMALVAAESSAEGTSLEVDLGKTRNAARVVKLPFYKRQ